MSDTQIIIFSKNRTLQLKSLLLSLFHQSDIQENEISILYVSDIDEISYQPLIDAYACDFIEQSDFIGDIQNILIKSGKRYVVFLCDDIMFRHGFELRQIEHFMHSHTDIDCFSFRLGEHIGYEPQPQFKRDDNGILTWRTGRDMGLIWKYFWELGSELYRVDRALDYVKKCKNKDITYPNPFESQFYELCPSYLGAGQRKLSNLLYHPLITLNPNKSHGMACFETSLCHAHGINQVALHHGADVDSALIELHERMLEGFVGDYRVMRGVENAKSNIGAKHFKLILETDLKSST
jgi:hypothetical protein